MNYGCWYAIVRSEKTHTLARNEFELLLRHPAVRKDTHAGLQRIPCKLVRNEQQKAQECITVSNLTDAAAPYCDRKTYSDSSNGDEQDLVTQTIRLYCFMPLSNTSVELLPAASLCLSMDLAVDQCIYMPVSLSIFLSIYLSLCLSICLSVYPLLQFSLCESEMTERSHCWTERPMLSLPLVYLSIYLSSCLPVYLWCSCTCRVVSLCTFSCRCSWSEATSAPPKVVRNPTVFNILTSKYASRHNGVRFFETPHLSLQKWSKPLVFCTFWLRNVLRATTACTFSKLDLWASKSGPNP